MTHWTQMPDQMDSEGSTDFSAGEDRKYVKNPYQQMVGMAG